ESGDVGWVLQYEGGNHFGDSKILSGYSDGLVYVGAMQFDISSIPQGSEITEAQLVLTGQSGRNLSSLGNGLWRIKMLQTEADFGWRSHSFPSLSSARVFAEMQPKLRQYDLDSGKQNVLVFDETMLRELEWRASTTGKVSFKIDGPRNGSRNVFDWESGYGLDSQHPPVLAIVYGPPNGNEPQPTAIPEHKERVDEIVRLINNARTSEGLTPLTVQPSLTRAAEIHNFDMTFHDFFSHTGSDGSSAAERVARTGYDAIVVGEILAARSSDPESVMTAWMARAQRDVILSADYTEIGADFTQYLGSSYNYYWTVVFAKPVQTP
ncbi:MAG: CAP domain-containing protein, partial [Anaerolineae bacterium]